MNRTEQLKVRMHVREIVQVKQNARAEGYNSVADFIRAVAAYSPPTEPPKLEGYNKDIGF